MTTSRRSCFGAQTRNLTPSQLAKVEGEIANIMTAIKQGILTATTKAELARAEAERTKLQEAIKTRATKADKLATLLPRAAECYRAVVNNLGGLSKTHVAQAREQIRELVGEIRLVPTATWRRC
jgi:site-specific DNA recombinase